MWRRHRRLQDGGVSRSREAGRSEQGAPALLKGAPYELDAVSLYEQPVLPLVWALQSSLRMKRSAYGSRRGRARQTHLAATAVPVMSGLLARLQSESLTCSVYWLTVASCTCSTMSLRGESVKYERRQQVGGAHLASGGPIGSVTPPRCGTSAHRSVDGNRSRSGGA